MRTKLRGKITLLFLALGLLLAVPAVALADTLTNELHTGVGNKKVVVPSESASVNTSVKYWIEAGNQGGLPGCDATVASPASVNVTASPQLSSFAPGATPAPVTVTPNPQSFTACSTDGGVTNSKSYTFTIPAGAPSGTYNVSAAVTDAVGQYGTSQASFDLVVNRPPTADAGGDANEKYFVNVGETVQLDGTGTDPEGKPLTYAWKFDNNDAGSDGDLHDDAAVEDPTFSAVGLTAGNYPIDLRVTDNVGLTATDDATVVVQNPNTAPVAVNDTYSTDEDQALNVSAPGVLANDTDAQNNDLTAVLVSGPSNAAANDGFTLNADGSFSYTPAANFNGNDTFTYKANDGTLDSNVVTVDLTVNAVNDPPVVSNLQGAGTANEGDTEAYTFDISDVDSNSFSFASGYPDCGGAGKGELVNGTAQISGNSGQFSCKFLDGAQAPTQVTVGAKITDGQDPSDVLTTNVSVSNVAPTLDGISASSPNALVNQNVTFTGGTTSDPAGTYDPLSWLWSKDGGAFASGSSTYTTSFATCGSHTVSAKVNDGDGGESAEKSASVNVYQAPYKAPLLDGSVNTVQKGRVIPVKISVGCGTNLVTGLAPRIDLLSGNVSPESESGSTALTTSVATADTGQTMRPVDGGYIYNLQVPSTAGTYTIRVNPWGVQTSAAAWSASSNYVVLDVRSK
jgi:hypothetical protein